MARREKDTLTWESTGYTDKKILKSNGRVAGKDSILYKLIEATSEAVGEQKNILRANMETLSSAAVKITDTFQHGAIIAEEGIVLVQGAKNMQITDPSLVWDFDLRHYGVHRLRYIEETGVQINIDGQRTTLHTLCKSRNLDIYTEILVLTEGLDRRLRFREGLKTPFTIAHDNGKFMGVAPLMHDILASTITNEFKSNGVPMLVDPQMVQERILYDIAVTLGVNSREAKR